MSGTVAQRIADFEKLERQMIDVMRARIAFEDANDEEKLRLFDIMKKKVPGKDNVILDWRVIGADVAIQITKTWLGAALLASVVKTEGERDDIHKLLLAELEGRAQA